MNKISVGNLIDYHRKSEKAKKTFLKNLTKEKVKTDDTGGGNYWVRSLSALSHAFHDNDNTHIQNKIDDIIEAAENTSLKTVKDMYQRNISILKNYEDFDFSSLHPPGGISIIEKIAKNPIIQIQNLPVQIRASQVFTFKKKDIQFTGGVCFVAKLDTYVDGELGMFAECLYRYLKNTFKDKYVVDSKYCIVIDVINMTEVNYEMIESGIVPRLLKQTLNSIKKNM